MELTFLHAGLLAGAGLAAVPVILHLILRQKPKQFVFPALRLVRMRHEANRRRLRFRHLLLLILRMLVIALMALSLARPRLGGVAAAEQEAPVAAAFVIDTSLSMQYRYENVTRLEQAQRLALELLDRLPLRSRVLVVESGSRPLEPEGPAGPGLDMPSLAGLWTTDLAGVRDRIGALEPRPAARPMHLAISEALERLADRSLSEQGRELYVFSDMTVGAWSTRDARSLKVLTESIPGLATYILDVGVDEPRNVSLGELAASQQVLLPGIPVNVQTVAQSVGEAAQPSLELYLGRDAQGKPIKRDEQLVDVPAGGAREVQFRVGGLPKGVHQGYVQISGGGDGLPFDDVRHLTLEVRPALRVLIVGTERDTVHWREALAPSELVRLQGGGAYEISRVEPAALNITALESAEVVCLINVPSLPDRVWDLLYSYVSEGGGLAILPGPAVEPANYNTRSAQRLMPARFVEVMSVPDEVHLAPENFTHPLLRHFRQWETYWQYRPVYRYFDIELGDGGAVVAPYSNGAAAMVERIISRGRVLLLTTSVSYRPGREAWNDLPSALGPVWMFIALADQMTQYLAGSTTEQLNYLAEEPTVRLRLDVAEGLSAYVLRMPGGQERQGGMEPGVAELVLPMPEQVGNYQVRAGSAENLSEKGFSVNAPPRESQLDRIGRAEMDQLFAADAYSLARDTEGLDLSLRQVRQGAEMFPLLIGLMLVLLAAEGLVAGRFYQQADAPATSAHRWGPALQGAVAIFAIVVGALIVGGSISAIRAAMIQSSRAVPWGYRLLELMVGLGLVGLGVVFGGALLKRWWPTWRERVFGRGRPATH